MNYVVTFGGNKPKWVPLKTLIGMSGHNRVRADSIAASMIAEDRTAMADAMYEHIQLFCDRSDMIGLCWLCATVEKGFAVWLSDEGEFVLTTVSVEFLMSLEGEVSGPAD